MRATKDLILSFGKKLITRMQRRAPDFIIGGHDNPYLLRWFLFGSEPHRDDPSRLQSKTVAGARAYLHCFKRSDDDRALHDHPSASISIALRGTAVEHTIAAGGVHHRHTITAGQVRCRSAHFAHRIEIEPGTEFWTLFIFFRDIREWGFHCPNGWVHWKKFTASDDPGAIGRGCGEG